MSNPNPLPPSPSAPTWVPVLLDQVSRSFEIAEPEEILAWALSTFNEGLAIGTAFGVSGVVLMDMALQINPDAEIFYIDTELFFDETYDLIRKLEDRYGRAFTRYAPELSVDAQAERFGADLWTRDSDQCCLMRKVLPMRRALQGRTGWVTALRRDQAGTRADTPIVALNRKFNVVKVAPLANWTERQIWQYVFDRQLPYNILHDYGYPSIGCRPCTQPVREGEDLRAGRWRGSDKTECGLHL